MSDMTVEGLDLLAAGGLSPISHHRGLSAQAREELRDAILDGRLPAGSLTSVRALSEALRISRTPVREALMDLANEGLVTFERSRGVRVNDSKAHDIIEIFQLRRMVEIPAIREAVPRFTASDVRALARELGAMRAHLDDERAFMQHDRAFHLVPLEVLGNARLIAIVESLRDQTRLRGLSTVGRSRNLRAIVVEHQAIYEAARGGRAARAAQAMERHLLITEELLRGQVDAARPERRAS
ncbi:MAG TPA: GntR family transcriptional regulator [Solirubrobacteraceae bacterium]|jgi:DNA-binding GntR family transcriptional regulator|nr:GntR family transcriptional regulator [Solirubrobacteraceae bacterium]